MKIKAVVLTSLFVAGLLASLAFADNPKHEHTSSSATTTQGATTGATTTVATPHTAKCGRVELKALATGGSVTFTVTKANKRGRNLVGTSVALVIPANARIKAKACSATTDGALTLRDLHITVSGDHS